MASSGEEESGLFTVGLDTLAFPNVFSATDGSILDLEGTLEAETYAHAYTVDETDTANGSYQVELTDLGSNTSRAAFEVVLDSTPPTAPQPGLLVGQGAQHLLLEGSALYYGPNSSGALALSLAPVDSQSGVAAVGFPALFGQDAVLLDAAPYQVSYAVDPGQDMSGAYTLSAADRVGNEALSPQFRLVKDSTAPTAAVFAPAQPALAFRVNWQGQDSQAGVAYYDLQYREKEAQDWGNWLDWQTGTQETSARFVGQAGYEYQFRVRAADRVGNLGEWVTGSPAAVQNVTIYYYAGSVRVAMRQGERVTYLLADHLGSTQVTADEQGSELGRYLYTAWGETRQVSGESATDRLYTGQRQEAEIGLYYYNARWYDPALGRFVQADTIVPNSNYPLAYDRYAYVYNNPIRYNDPSGHTVCDEYGNCHNTQGWFRAPGSPRPTSDEGWKMLIYHSYSVTMSDATGKRWTTANLQYTYESLTKVDIKLGGQLSSLLVGATFQMGEYQVAKECPECTYSGWTVGTKVTFFTLGNSMLVQMNIFHELAHVIDNNPNSMDYFSHALENYAYRSFIDELGYLNGDALIERSVNDRFSGSTQAIQHPISCIDDPHDGPQEHFADIFANYVAGNINTSFDLGIDMNRFITETFASYFGGTP
jgi:RHS repeat-associated protein